MGPAMMTASGGGGAEPDVAGLRRELEAFLTLIGDDRALRWLGPGPSAAPARAKIVVVGEVGTGKSALINALLGRAALLPTAAITAGTATTATYVAVGADTAEGIRAFGDDGQVLTGCDAFQPAGRTVGAVKFTRQGNFRGPLSMYLRAGFEPYRETERNVIVRKKL